MSKGLGRMSVESLYQSINLQIYRCLSPLNGSFIVFSVQIALDSGWNSSPVPRIVQILILVSDGFVSGCVDFLQKTRVKSEESPLFHKILEQMSFNLDAQPYSVPKQHYESIQK